MKPSNNYAARLRAVITGLLPALLFSLGTFTVSAATSYPPERMTFQGFLQDGSAVPLGNSGPKNYDVVFRIYNDQSAGDLLWAEQQTITADKGYFSVLLGEGADSGGEPRPLLRDVFTGIDASDRFVGITVKGIGSGGSNVDILPRLRLLPSPYAFMARTARGLVSQSGTVLATAQEGELILNGSIVGDGSQLAGFTSSQIPNLNASKIDAGILNADRIPNLNASKIDAGTLSASRIPNLNASKINAGILGADRIPFLDGSKINSGLIPQARLSFPAPQRFDADIRVERIGVGVAPAFALHVDGTGNANDWDIILQDSGVDFIYNRTGMRISNPIGTINDGFFEISANVNVPNGTFARLNSSGVWGASSDRRLKRDIKQVTGLLEKTLALRPVTFRFKAHVERDANTPDEIGLIAQEVEEHFPSLVSGGGEGMRSVNYSGLSVVAIGAIQEQQKQIGELTRQNRQLLKRMAAMEKLISTITKQAR